MKKQKTSQPKAMQKLYALTEKRPIDLSLSENPLGCSSLVSDAFKNMRTEFSDYPSPNARLLKKKLAQKFSLDTSNFFVANGSESIINDLPRIFGEVGDEVLVPTLTFPMFVVCSELAGKKVITVKMGVDLGIDLDEITKFVSVRTSLIFICSPNNPTGGVLTKKAIMRFVRSVPQEVLVIVDEANIEFGGETVADEVVNQKNLIILRTFSKAFGLASLRIGFAVANEAIIRKLEEETPIFQVSGLSEQLACIALDDDLFLQETKQFISEQRLFLRNSLRRLGCMVFPSEANNLFIKLPKTIKADCFVEFIEKEGISLVIGSNFVGFDNSFFRVSVRSAKINKLFVRKMSEFVAHNQSEPTFID